MSVESGLARCFSSSITAGVLFPLQLHPPRSFTTFTLLVSTYALPHIEYSLRSFPIANFPSLIPINRIPFRVPTETDPVQRFVQTVKYYLSGWHIRPKVRSCRDSIPLLLISTSAIPFYPSVSLCPSYLPLFLLPQIGCQETLQPRAWGILSLPMEAARSVRVVLYCGTSLPSSANVGILLQ